MGTQILQIALFTIIATLIICLIKNIKNIFEFTKNKKILKRIVKVISIIAIVGGVAVYLYKQCDDIKNNINVYIASVENDKMCEIHDEKSNAEKEFYEKVFNKEYINSNSNNPYIPKDFEYVEGEWNNGFVIQDSNKNQYVWIPCTNKDNNEIPKLERKNFSVQSLISKDECNNESYEKFLTSSLENGGFYISRFEIGKENDKPVSKGNAEIWADITRDEAIDIVDKMYDSINCELINGYAYDTTLSWIMSNNKVKISNFNIDAEKLCTGRASYNRIYDFFDNVMEITLETSYDTVIVRGYPYIITKEVEKALSDSMEMNTENIDRLSILKDDKKMSDTTMLGLRTIIYK